MNDHLKIDQLTPEHQILRELGRRLTRLRKQQHRSQEALAKQAGIGVATLRRIEDGKDGQLSSWLKLLKALGLQASIEGLLPATFDSPRAEVLANTKSPRGKAKGAGKGFRWGDEAS